jgi:alkylated DNA repair dioxygenase AlkB
MPSFMGAQTWLFGREEPRFDASFSRVERFTLAEGAWIELQRGWLDGHARLFDELRETTPWQAERRHMYERVVDVPRLFAALESPRAPIIEAMRQALGARYRTVFDSVTAACYRDGRDSVAWHGDREADSLVATVSVGAPRKFRVRPFGGGRSLAFPLGCGDLIVMGGSFQRTYQHAVPKVAWAEPRIAVMFR